MRSIQGEGREREERGLCTEGKMEILLGGSFGWKSRSSRTRKDVDAGSSVRKVYLEEGREISVHWREGGSRSGKSMQGKEEEEGRGKEAGGKICMMKKIFLSCFCFCCC